MEIIQAIGLLAVFRWLFKPKPKVMMDKDGDFGVGNLSYQGGYPYDANPYQERFQEEANAYWSAWSKQMEERHGAWKRSRRPPIE